MKKLLSLYIVTLGILFSCVEDVAPEDAYGKSPDLVTFATASTNLSVEADGNDWEIYSLPVTLEGPKANTRKGDLTVTFEVDPSSTAIEGTHFEIPNATMVLKESEGYGGRLPIRVKTAGIQAPLESNPVLAVRVASVSGEGSEGVVASGKPVRANILYLCESVLDGEYSLKVTRLDNGAVSNFPNETITKTGLGAYRGTVVGNYGNGALAGTPGFDFVEVCGVITVGEQNLANVYSNMVYGVRESKVLENGDIIIFVEITFAAGNRIFQMEYTKK
jgi:hypothetical protein